MESEKNIKKSMKNYIETFFELPKLKVFSNEFAEKIGKSALEREIYGTVPERYFLAFFKKENLYLSQKKLKKLFFLVFGNSPYISS